MIHSISLSFGKGVPSLWYDTVKSGYDAKGWGILIQLHIGSFARPVRKFWTDKNPWQEEAWFTIRLPIIILPFISIAIHKFGIYLGGKAFTVDSDEPWAKESEYGKRMLTISATIRRTRDE